MDNRSCRNADHSRQRAQRLRGIGLGAILLLGLLVYSEIYTTPLCLFRHLFHIACPGCGLTRGFRAILELDFQQATSCNILSVPLFFGILGYCLCSVAELLWGCRLVRRMEKRLLKKRMFILYGGMAAITTILNNR